MADSRRKAASAANQACILCRAVCNEREIARAVSCEHVAVACIFYSNNSDILGCSQCAWRA